MSSARASRVSLGLRRLGMQGRMERGRMQKCVWSWTRLPKPWRSTQGRAPKNRTGVAGEALTRRERGVSRARGGFQRRRLRRQRLVRPTKLLLGCVQVSCVCVSHKVCLCVLSVACQVSVSVSLSFSLSLSVCVNMCVCVCVCVCVNICICIEHTVVCVCVFIL